MTARAAFPTHGVLEPQRKDCAYARIAEIKPRPHEDAQVHPEQQVTEHRACDTLVGRYSAAEIAAEEQRSEHACLRIGIEPGTDKQDNAEWHDGTDGLAKL
jgi:hypothetical protein